MNELSTQIKSDWLTVKEVAKILGVTVNAIHQDLIRYPEVKEMHTRREGDDETYFGKRDTRPLLLSKHGLTLLVALQGTSRNANDNNVTCAKKETKRQIVEKGVESMGQIAQLSQRISELEALIKNPPKQLQIGSKALGPYLSDRPAPPLSTRSKIKMLVNNFVENSRFPCTHAEVYNHLYQEMYYRCNVNVTLKAKNRKIPTIEMVEELDLMEDLFAIATQVLT